LNAQDVPLSNFNMSVDTPKEEIKSEYICEDDFQRIISGDVNEVIIDGVKYKKVTQTITSWRKIS